jgi:hypothetical protein
MDSMELKYKVMMIAIAGYGVYMYLVCKAVFI